MKEYEVSFVNQVKRGRFVRALLGVLLSSGIRMFLSSWGTSQMRIYDLFCDRRKRGGSQSDSCFCPFFKLLQFKIVNMTRFSILA